MTERKQHHKANLSIGGKYDWWTLSRHSVHLQRFKVMRNQGYTWDRIIEKLGLTTTPTVLSRFYRKNFGKVTPFELRNLKKFGVPKRINPPEHWEEITNSAWIRLQAGERPSRVAEFMDGLGWKAHPKVKRNFMRDWMKNVALEVWKMSEEEIRAFRENKSRKRGQK